MRGAQQFLEQNRFLDVDFGGFVESKSTPGKKYFVSKKGNQWFCECVAGLMKHLCSHIKELANKMGEGDKCFYCGITRYAAGSLERHHVYRRSTHPEFKEDHEKIMLLCRQCHERATADHKFEVNLQKIWEIKKGQNQK